MPKLQTLGQCAADPRRRQRVNGVDMGGGGLIVLLWCTVSFVLAFVLIRLILAYATQRGLLDHPGPRRSHTEPTPRGGGLGVVLGALPGLLWALLLWPFSPWSTLSVAAVLAATVLVLLVGWIDDHGHLPAWQRILVHMLAAALAAWAVLDGSGLALPWFIALGFALAAAIAWSINLHNFMDGIDGLLGLQAIFYFTALGVLAFVLERPMLGCAAWCVAAASVAFLTYNWPPARIFMGDAGSCALGLFVALLAAMLWRQAPNALWPALTLCSGFVVDATLTLLLRMLRGRRWYTAHREHLYQWLVRSGRSHAQTGRLYMLWNLLIVAPSAWLAVQWPQWGAPICVLVYALGASLWWFGRRACVQREAGNEQHAA